MKTLRILMITSLVMTFCTGAQAQSPCWASLTIQAEDYQTVSGIITETLEQKGYEITGDSYADYDFRLEVGFNRFGDYSAYLTYRPYDDGHSLEASGKSVEEALEALSLLIPYCPAGGEPNPAPIPLDEEIEGIKELGAPLSQTSCGV